jgi:hypothetical protein
MAAICVSWLHQVLRSHAAQYGRGRVELVDEREAAATPLSGPLPTTNRNRSDIEARLLESLGRHRQ